MALKLYKSHRENDLLSNYPVLNDMNQVLDKCRELHEKGITSTTFSLVDDNDGLGCFLRPGMKRGNVIGYYVLPGFYTLGIRNEILEYREDNKPTKYSFTVIETLEKTVTVIANNEDEALKTVKGLYDNELIILDANDHKSTEFELEYEEASEYCMGVDNENC